MILLCLVQEHMLISSGTWALLVHCFRTWAHELVYERRLLVHISRLLCIAHEWPLDVLLQTLCVSYNLSFLNSMYIAPFLSVLLNCTSAPDYCSAAPDYYCIKHDFFLSSDTVFSWDQLSCCIHNFGTRFKHKAWFCPLEIALQPLWGQQDMNSASFR